MFFQDRDDAAEKLLKKLNKFKRKRKLVVIGVPRGGVPLAKRIADGINKPLDIIVTKKIGAPFNKEYAIGAITEDGTPILDEKNKQTVDVPQSYLEEEIKAQKEEVDRRLKKYRGQKEPLDLDNKTALIIDDGVATGNTMKATIKSAQEKGAKKIIVAVPVGAPDTIDELNNLADEIICLEEPKSFGAIGRFYYDFEQVSDDEVIEALNK
ncbi:MAG: phosphoribosyltransferase [Candidatus Paceibacteria bacterium]